MPTFESPTADADEVKTALRALAHATRAIDDLRQIYSVLGSLTSAVASMSQSLHQLATFHDGRQKRTEWVPTDSPKARSAAFRLSWDLHRAGQMLRQVGDVIANAREAEAVLAYHRECGEHMLSRSSANQELSL